MNQAINKLKMFQFSHPQWDDTVWYLQRDYGKAIPSPWKDISLPIKSLPLAYLPENEKRYLTPFAYPMVLVEEMRNLYDLAFLGSLRC